ncbi:MAG: hypothetical protein N2C14_23850, partial [Planctomycetales bacterium]
MKWFVYSSCCLMFLSLAAPRVQGASVPELQKTADAITASFNDKDKDFYLHWTEDAEISTADGKVGKTRVGIKKLFDEHFAESKAKISKITIESAQQI